MNNIIEKLDELNQSDKIEYSDYSELHDMVTDLGCDKEMLESENRALKKALNSISEQIHGVKELLV